MNYLLKRELLGCEDVALVRLEQMYPIQQDTMDHILTKYTNRSQLLWVQEEPENMGAWTYILRTFRHEGIEVIAPVPSGSPAPGSHKMFERNQTALINRAFTASSFVMRPSRPEPLTWAESIPFSSNTFFAAGEGDRGITRRLGRFFFLNCFLFFSTSLFCDWRSYFCFAGC